MATRRAFLAGLAIASLPRVTWAEVGSPACLAAGKRGDDFVLHGLSDQGVSLFEIPLPARGHAAAGHPHQALAVAFARRPGTYALVMDCLTGRIRHQLTPPQDRQFNGHGAFSGDGQFLLTSEVVATGSAGRIGIWDARDFRRMGEWDSGGIGPHDIKLLPDGTLLVANGGIETDASDRAKLNIDTMRPNLTLLSDGGAILDQIQLGDDLRQNSIRHLALTPNGAAFAMQWEGDAALPTPQLGLWQRGRPVQLCPPNDPFAMRGYAGSIAVMGGQIGLTSAPAGALLLFDTAGKQIAAHARADISGIAATAGGMMATDGQGGVWRVTNGALTLLARHDTQWDNHLIALS